MAIGDIFGRIPGLVDQFNATRRSTNQQGQLSFLSGFADKLDLPKFGGPYAAPLTQGQLDSIQGFNRLFNGDPLLQTQDLRKSIEFALTGGPVHHPNFGKTLTQQVEPFRLPSTATEAAKIGANNGFFSGYLPQFSDLSGVNNRVNSFLDNPATRSDFSSFDSAFRKLGVGNRVAGASDIEQIARNTGATASGITPDMGNVNRLASSIFGNNPGVDTRGTDGLISQVAGRGLNNPARFDTTQLFNAGEDVMRRDVEDTLAQVREEYSGLGLGPGSSDRAMGLTRAAGDVFNKFRLGQQQIGMEAFENAENRGLQGLGIAGSMAPQALASARTPAEVALERRGQDIGAIPGMTNAAGLPASLRLDGLRTQLAALDPQLAARFTPEQLNATMRGQDISGMLPAMFQRAQVPFEQDVVDRNSRGNFLPQLADIASRPFQEQLAIAQGLYEPAADRRLQSAGLLGQLENVPFDRFFNTAEAAANRSMALIPQLFNLEQRPFDRMIQQFQLNEAARGVADTETTRRQAEHARTQGGGLDQILKVLSTIRPNETGVGPSGVSQFGDLLKGVGSIFGAFKGGG
jgi:hypothetical protein